MTKAFWKQSNFSFANGAGYQNAEVISNFFFDIDSDGDTDFVAGRDILPGTAQVPVVIMLNDGKGHFTDQTSKFFPGGAPTSVAPNKGALGDFNGDSRLDLFIVNNGTDGFNNGGQNALILSAGPNGLADGKAFLPQRLTITPEAAAVDIDGDHDLARLIHDGPVRGLADVA